MDRVQQREVAFGIVKGFLTIHTGIVSRATIVCMFDEAGKAAKIPSEKIEELVHDINTEILS